MRVRGFVGKAIRLLVIGLLATIPELASVRAARIPLGNPYGKPRVDFDNLPVPVYESDCDYTWGRVITELNNARIRENLCVRAMASPYQENFDRAVQDAANAMLRGDDISEIMRAWPIEVRKEIHDEALSQAKSKGSTMTSTMPERDTTKDKDDWDKFIEAPYHLFVYSSEKLADASPSKSIKQELRR